MKYKDFLNCSNHFMRNYHYHYCWNIVSQNLNKKADY